MITHKKLPRVSPAVAAIREKAAAEKGQLFNQGRSLSSVKSPKLEPSKLEPYVMPSTEERVEALAKAQTTERVIHEKERAEITGISRTSWYRLELFKQVPEYGTNGKRKFWMISDIYVYLYRKTGSGPLPHKG